MHPSLLSVILSGIVEMVQTTAKPEYSFSFLAGALYLPESLAIADLLCDGLGWQEIVRRSTVDNLIRQRTAASRTRILREIRYRLEQLSHEQLEFLCEAGSRDQRNLLFLAMCQRFRFIGEFVEEVLRPKAQGLEFQLRPADFARFFDRKAAEAPEIDELTDKSRAKIKQVLIRILAEAGLINSTADQRIQRIIPSKALIRTISDTRLLRFLLLSDAEIRQLTP